MTLPCTETEHPTMQGQWKTESIGGKPAAIYQPAGKQPPRFGILHLHGIGQETLQDRPAYSRWFDEFNLACVCPSGGYSWWSDKICSTYDPAQSAERYLLTSVVPFFKERWNILPRAIGLQGISMGGQGALRLAFKHAKLFPVVAGIASAIDHYEYFGQGLALDEMYDSKEQCRQDSAPLHIHPNDYPMHIYFCIDPTDEDWMRGNDRLHEKLSALGVAHQVDFSTRAGGHSWDYFNHVAEAVERFVHNALVLESRRLL